MIGQSGPMVASGVRPLARPPVDLLRDGCLFLDFDGTLVELAESPDAVRVEQRLSRLMHALHDRLAGRIAVISGRPAGQVRELFDTDLIVVGSHGLEFIARDGTSRTPDRPIALGEVRASMDNLAARLSGVLVEDKPFGVALHFRRCPEAEADCIGLASTLAAAHDLHLQPGKMMIEVRAGGGDKGSAIRTLMREPDMGGRRPVFMGDDLTDEPGFVAAEELGGAGILVGEPRETAARYRLAGVEATLAWLEAASAEVA
jgi:trehalose 6-phosphate phosphatase